MDKNVSEELSSESFKCVADYLDKSSVQVVMDMYGGMLAPSAMTQPASPRLASLVVKDACENLLAPTKPNSHVSSSSFLVNRHRTLFSPFMPSFSTQVRGFKTREVDAPPPSGGIALANIFGRKSKDLPQENTKLTDLLAEHRDAGEQARLKQSFADGYTVGQGDSGTTSRASKWLRNAQNILGIVVLMALLASLMNSMGFKMSVVNGSANEVEPEEINVCFDDVKGVEEAKAELEEVVEFLSNPSKFTTLGAELPKGVLLVGPPGTGKTLLARAVAGEAGVPFFHAAGPEFDEVLVGQGARRVRDLFKAAKERSPCVVFIDEIDSVGGKRSSSVLHPYANQTINQLLAEMDGFHKNDGVIVLGATNRKQDLDKALLRPGRFDVQVEVPAPDVKGRVELLKFYLKSVAAGDDIDVTKMAKGTTGFTGADIKNVVNQAALRAAIDRSECVNHEHLEIARDKLLMGPERKSRLIDEKVNRVTAYHEGGHTIVAYCTKHSHPLHKVTIMPRAGSLGHTAYIPEDDQYSQSRAQMMAQLDTLMGGRAAEALVFGEEMVTSGASNDLERATDLASAMVKAYGMSERVGLRTFEERSQYGGQDYAPSTREAIDAEINRLLSESYARAVAILKTHEKQHHALADALLLHETLSADDVGCVMQGKPIDRDVV